MTDSTSAVQPDSSRDASDSAELHQEDRVENTSSDERDIALALGALLVVGILALFFMSLFGEFVYDDARLIQSNPRLASFSALMDGMLAPHWSFDDASDATQVGYWRPLSLIALWIGNMIGDGAPLGFHLMSVIVHLLASLAAWRFVHVLTGNLTIGWMAAALFAVHPVQVESVAWISAINDPLAALFGLLTMTAWMRWRASAAGSLPIAAAIYFACALLAKEQAIALPLILVALDLGAKWNSQRRTATHSDRASGFSDWLRAFIPIGVVLVLYWAARAVVFSEVTAGFLRTNSDYGFSVARMATLRLELFGGFMQLLAWPLDLAVFRGLVPVRPDGDITLMMSAGVALLWLVALIISLLKRAGPSAVMLLVLPIALLPVLLNPESAGAFPLSDRYLYLPVLAFTTLVAIALSRLPQQNLLQLAFVVLLAPMAWRATTHVATFSNNEAFFRQATTASPRVPTVHWGLGRELLEKYKQEKAPEQLQEAFLSFLTSLYLGTDYGEQGAKLGPEAPLGARLQEMESVISDAKPKLLRPDRSVFVEPWDRLQANLGQGWCYLYRAEAYEEYDLDPALIVFREIARVFTHSYRAKIGLGVTLMQRGDLEEASEVLAQAVQMNDLNPEAWHNYGQLLKRLREWEGGRNAFERALHLRPKNQDDLVGIAVCAIESERFKIADLRLSQARELYPNSLEPIFWSGILAGRKRDLADALAWFDDLISRKEDFGLAHLERGKALWHMEQGAAAVKSFGRACELLPTNFEAYYNLGTLLITGGDGGAALPYLVKAYTLSKSGEIRDRLHMTLSDMLVGDPDTAMGLARASAGNGDFEAALDWVERTMSLHDRIALTADANFLRGDYLNQLERPEEAAASYTRALQLDPNHFWATHNLGIVYAMKLSRGGKAKPHLQRVLDMLPGMTAFGEDMKSAIRDRMQSTLNGISNQSTAPADESQGE
ncbi:MAG: tetratricopeptide (TPR) repeat protein [Planctomycetota bacterium]|jgi:tetratricopeptide (TPR) repeat protein